MAHRKGYLRIDYEGAIPQGLTEHLSETAGVSAASFRPLILNSSSPDRLLNEIAPYLSDAEMQVERIVLRPSAL